MYLNIGQDTVITDKNILGIFDLDTSTVSKTGKDFINRKEKEGLVEYDDYDLPRSFVLVNEDGKYKVKLSRISSAGLKMRAQEEISDAE